MRASNEDAFAFDNDLGVFVVADGMGGHAAGEIASQEAVDAVISMVKKQQETILELIMGTRSPELLRKFQRVAESAVQAATYMIYSIAQSQPDQKGMGTTVSALVLASNVGVTAQVGDSRIYLVRKGEVRKLTQDHTLVAWQLREGLITPQEAERSPHKNVITRAVGSKDYVQVDTTLFDVESGDRFLLCSDGLYGYLSDEEIASVIGLDPESAAERFIDIANERGGKDNITAVVIHVE